MPVFGAYSRYYNLLYRDKDYAAEAEYVIALVNKHLPAARSLLDLGCGTGQHDLLLARNGYEIAGVDLSEEMLAVARSQLEELNSRPLPGVAPHQHAPRRLSLNFQQGDIRTIRLGRSFDTVIALFHVMSYQASNDDLRAAFATARTHLNPGGVFIFDCWYGPAVLTQRPEVRVKRLEDEAMSITRIADPTMHPNANLVDVNYQVLIRDKATGAVEEMHETHRMRYLFQPEVETFLREAGMRIVEVSEWMTGDSPGFDTWGVCYVVKCIQ
jgi:SAM-dependent methyltransferase